MTLKGSCHCKATQFEVSEPPATVTSCNCSFCSKRGALHAYYTPDQFKLTTARDRVTTYQWRSYNVQHHHCAICGCPTFAESPDFSTGVADPSHPKISVNARLFDDFDLDRIEVVHIDGKTLW